jgi:hypothetical protein
LGGSSPVRTLKNAIAYQRKTFGLPRRRLLARAVAIFLLPPALTASQKHARVDDSPETVALTARAPTGIAVTVRSSGRYVIRVSEPGWTFAGDLHQPLADLSMNSGADSQGAYQEIAFNYFDAVVREGRIRVYLGSPVVLFTGKYLGASANAAPFPALTSYPQGLYHFSYNGLFAPPAFGYLGAEGPWLFFDSELNAFILSAASNFMTATTSLGAGQEIRSGIKSDISVLPEGFTHQTVLVVEKGINRAFERWGRVITDLQEKRRPSNDADASLAYLGYWTDNGATYYYNFEPALGYSGTLLAIREQFARLGIPLGYVQLDSWFYPKGQGAKWGDFGGGIYEYRADSSLFPGDLAAFQRSLRLPLIMHGRWIDARSPYRWQYRMSGNVSIDPLFWDHLAAYLQNSGAGTYEQDWLGSEAQPASNLGDPEVFLGNMARALGKRQITIQYCTALPRHFLQSSKYENVTTIRTSADRFSRDKWNDFLYSSRFASALGIWPWADVFRSDELENLLLATLSAGPVGVGDRLGQTNQANLLRAVRKDGVIVKPDVPMVPVDQSFLNDAQGLDRPMVASTYTDFGGLKAVYVFAFDRTGSFMPAEFRPSDLGFGGAVYAYNYFERTGRMIDAGELASEPASNGFSFLILVPVGSSGIAFLGDAEHFVSLGKKRITRLSDSGTLEVAIAFAEGETARTLHGYAPAPPRASALKGASGPVDYDSSKKLFQVQVSPDADRTAVIQIWLAGG